MIRSAGRDNSSALHSDPLDLDTTLSARFERAIRNSLLGILAFTVLAFGTVEYWSIALFGFLVTSLFVLWGFKVVFSSHSRIYFPSLLLPLLFAIIYAIVQVITSVDADGRHWSLSMDPEATWLVIEVLTVLLIACLLITNIFNTRHRLILLRNFLIIFGLIYSVFAIVNHLTWNGRYYWIIDPTTPSSHPFGSFVNHNHFAGFVEMLAPLPLALVLTRAVRNELAILNAFAAIILSVATILSLSRGGMISLVSGLLFTFTIGLRSPFNSLGSSNRLRLFLARMISVLVLLLAIAIGILWVGGDAVIQRLDIPTTEITSSNQQSVDPAGSAFYQSRGFIWEDTVRMIRSNWLIGVGLGAYQTAYPIYSKQDRLYLVGQSHNDFLQLAADGGIVLVLIALLFLILLIRCGYKAINHPDPTLSSLAIGSCGGIFALLVHGLFDFNFQIVSNILHFFTLSIIVWIIAFKASSKRVGEGLFLQSRLHPDDQFASNEMEVSP